MTTHFRARCSALVIVTFVFTMVPALLPAGDNGKARPAAAPAAGTSRFSLDEWRASREEYSEVMHAESPEEKIEKLEAFLAAHPDYQYRTMARLVLADARVESGRYDPKAVTQTLLDALEEPGWGCDSVVYRVKSYSAKSQFPLEDAWRVLEAAKEGASRDLRGSGKKEARNETPWQDYDLRQCDYRATLAEGQILLDRGDAAGALPLLRRAESSGTLNGNDLLMVDEKGASRGILPTGESEALHLALAKAYARTGDRQAAREHLARLSLHSTDADEQKDLDSIASELGWSHPAGREWTTDPIQAAPFELLDLQGKKVKYADYKGKVILLNFWSTT